MKKFLLFTSILVATWGVNLALSLEKPTNKVINAHEISYFLLNYQNFPQASGQAQQIIDYFNNLFYVEKPAKLMMSTMTEVLYKEWDGNDWVNAQLDQMHYDAIGWATETFSFIWEDNMWVNSMWSIITNNTSGTPVMVQVKLWDGSNWLDMMKISYTYNSYGYSQILMEFFLGGNWMNYMKLDFYYNAQNLCNEIITQGWDVVTSSWENDDKDSFTYNGNGWMIEELSQKWENAAWLNEEISYSTYEPNGHEIERLALAWYNNAWENYLHFTTTYNGLWQETQHQIEIWYNAVWENHELFLFQYDAQGRMIEELYKTWVAKGWENDELTTWTYDLSTGINPLNEQPGLSFTIGPNPATNLTLIEYTLDLASLITLKLYDFTGNLVKELYFGIQGAGTHNFNLQTSDLPAGIYIVTLQNNEGVKISHRLVVIK